VNWLAEVISIVLLFFDMLDVHAEFAQYVEGV
jgi:hypothetical protein